MAWFRFAAPQPFYELTGRLLPWLWGLAALLAVAGLVVGLGIAPTDFQQGDSYRIIYIHVPAAWMSMLIYVVMAFWAGVGLVLNTRVSSMLASALAPTGALMTFIALWTGALWGKPTWGTYWIWDARLTSVLVLFFLYLGYMGVWAAIDERAKAAKAAAILCVVGVINIPIIRFSVEWWDTLHQGPSVVRFEDGKLAPSIDGSMLWPLLIVAIGCTVLFFALLFVRMRTDIAQRRIRTLMAQRAAA